jgi:predicted membrane protein
MPEIVHHSPVSNHHWPFSTGNGSWFYVDYARSKEYLPDHEEKKVKNHGVRHKITPQLFIGVFVIILGLIFMLDHLKVLDAGNLVRYWPAIIVLYGLGRLSQGWRGRGMFSGIFFIVVGGLLLLSNLGMISFYLWDYWPLILLFLGFMLVRRAIGKKPEGEASGTESRVNSFVLFGGVERRNSSQDFKGGEVTAILGGCELDLRGASIANGEAVIDVLTFWGGIDIKVPEDWTVSIESMPFMGGCEDKTRHEKGSAGKHLIVKGYVIMGGLQIG